MNKDLFFTTLLQRRASFKCLVPVRSEATRFVEDLMQFLFPHFTEQIYYTPEEMEAKFVLLQRNLKSIVRTLDIPDSPNRDTVAEAFFEQLPAVYNLLISDAEAIYAGDPAAESVDEVILAYPGFFAIAVQRFAHIFYNLNVPVFPRLLTEYAHQLTGIDIHPGASIGRGCCIDHGTGVVIGETSVIGNNVKIYQGVTLGALSVDKIMVNVKRHPTIEDNVVIYAQAVILGGDTVIGHDSIIGGNSWITESVPPNSIVTHKNDVRVRTAGDTTGAIDFCI